ncbi:dehydration-responsive element-binding protein 1B-like [Cynara cardunculus var. scolymus]|uniref:AP2/ERF domain-containing protein n=1 Tax=Cynara cardunculus var. scolymus TaxID=59895 RepID=A0A103XH82_CYNCS|nr:dehydration-responsive element-binding protein 1B-like [Cynara cardunculus var. scolymus]KVH90650.1 AP2/ERF domain-containing protein [Cynara cardunculus var. scolymus]
MEIIEDDASSSSASSSSSSQKDTNKIVVPPLMKRKAGRKKFKETRHPIYRGVRLRNGTKWVCEIREPSKKSRIWLGTFPTPEMAARAFDAATLSLRGDKSPLNFPDSAHLVRRAKSSSVRDIQEVAMEAAIAFGPKRFENSSVLASTSLRSEQVVVEVAETAFVDEEVLFNMPSFYNSMAEGLVITPPGMKKGFDWNDEFDSDIDLTLWRY